MTPVYIAYALTILLIVSGMFPLITIPFAIVGGLLKLPAVLLTFCSCVFGWFLIDLAWQFGGAGILPIIVLGFAFIWSPIFAKLKASKLKDSGLLALHGQGWAAAIYGIFLIVTSDIIRWY